MTAQPGSDLVHVIYASAATRPFARDELLALLEAARWINSSLEVTGILLYVDETFFQVLEGAPEVVERLYKRIGMDKRHERVLKLIQEPIAKRAFPNWSMGFAALTRADLATIPGLTDFFTSKETLLALPEGRVRKLLDAFAEGRWRSRVLP